MNVYFVKGYLISGNRLDNDDFNDDMSSIRSLSTLSTSSFEQLLRGNTSFGHFLEAEGYESVPSPTNSGPNGELYFSGATIM